MTEQNIMRVLKECLNKWGFMSMPTRTHTEADVRTLVTKDPIMDAYVKMKVDENNNND